MKSFILRHCKTLLILLFGVAVFLFWTKPYYSMLSFQEQLQMFLWDGSYFSERITLPGGLADWLGEFLVQFYYIPILGAVIIALLFMLLQTIIYLSPRTNNSISFALSFLPVFLLWGYLCDENALMSFVVACLFCSLAMFCYTRLRSPWAQLWIYPLVTAAILFWTMGAIVWSFVLFVVLWQFAHKQTGRWLSSVIIVLFTILLVVGSSFIVPYPLSYIARGINYYRFPQVLPHLVPATMVLLAVVPVFCSWAAQRSWRHGRTATAAISILIIIGGAGFVWGCTDKMKMEVINHDFMVRTGNWQKIIEEAEKQNPTTPTSVASLNLALQQTGQLCDRLFKFYQNGTQGLLPEFQRDFITPLVTSEVFLRLGMVNDALRYNYEAQEAIPNYRKSGRMTKRIAECNLIKGEYGVAMKYLRKLEKTLFYRQWAKNTMELLKTPKAVAKHPFYGQLRTLMEHSDYLFSDREMDQMLGMLLVSNKQNRMAYEYLMAYELLNRDVERFEQYYTLGQYQHYDHIPQPFVEARLFYWSQHQNESKHLPAGTDQITYQRFMDFGNVMQTKDAARMNSFRGTYWYYLFNNQTMTPQQGAPK